jgi:hypothetical protein
MNEKKCTKCGEIKLLTCYFVNVGGKRPGKVASLCKDCESLKSKVYRAKNRDMVLAKSSAYHKRTLDFQRKRKKLYYQENKSEVLERCIAYRKASRKNNPQVRLRDMLRGRVRNCIVKGFCSPTTKLYLGCNSVQLRKHLQSKFTDGMSWDNYGRGGWEIDHIRPCCYFDLTDEEQVKICFNFSNLQPLWSADNRKKWTRTNVPA